jgi:hypothetical protein
MTRQFSQLTRAVRMRFTGYVTERALQRLDARMLADIGHPAGGDWRNGLRRASRGIADVNALMLHIDTE